jgi:hypothetical protein
MLPVNLFVIVICPVYDIIHEIVMVANIYETNYKIFDNTIFQQCIDPPCLVKCSGQGGGVVSRSPKYIIKKRFSRICSRKRKFLLTFRENVCIPIFSLYIQ